MTDHWEVRPCKDRLGNVTSYDLCLPQETGSNGVAVIASVYSGEKVANQIAALWNTRPNQEATRTDGDGETELDANGEAMICEGCGTTRTIAAILERHGPKAIACCPERKMVEARHFWRQASAKPDPEAVTRRELVEGLSDKALMPILREMYARTAEAWLMAPEWAGAPYRAGERDWLLEERGLPVLRAHIDALLTKATRP